MAEAQVLVRRKSFTLVLLLVALFCLCSALAQSGPEQLFSSALYCFYNKQVYNRCNGAYRLSESGELNVPPEATNEFCNGDCLSETHSLLNCINSVGNRFIFSNGATIGNMRGMLNAACTFSSRRGNFNVGDYMGLGISNTSGLSKQISVSSLLLMVLGWFLLLL